MPTYTRTQTLQALRWTDDLSANDVVQWIHRQGGRARALLTRLTDQVLVNNKALGQSYMGRGDWVIESKLLAETRPHDPITAFVTCDPETFTREGWTLQTAPESERRLREEAHVPEELVVEGSGRPISTQHVFDELVGEDEQRCSSDGATFAEHYEQGFTDGQKESASHEQQSKALAERVLSEMKRAEQAETSLETVTAALAELIRLKDGPRDDAYRAAKEAAWDAARAGVQDVSKYQVSDATLETMAAGGYAIPLFPQPDGTVKVGRSPETEHDTLAEIERLRASVRKWKSGCGEWIALATDSQARADNAEERLERIKRIFRDE